MILKNWYRGGLQKILPLALCISLLSFGIMPAHAAEDSWNLYVWNGSEFVQPTGTENVKFTTVGAMPKNGGPFNKQFVGCAIDTDGNKWSGPYIDASNNNNTTPDAGWTADGWAKDNSGDNCNTSGWKINDTYSVSNPATGPLPYRVRGTSQRVSADRNGDLWWTATSVPQILPDSKTIQAHQVAEYTLTTVKAATTGIMVLGTPRTNTSTYVAQLPQSGDPAESIWQSVTILTAISCVSLAFTMTRMRRKNDSHI